VESSHRLLGPPFDKQPIHWVRSEETEDHADLHHEPLQWLVRHQMRIREEDEVGERHPAEEADFKREDR
jgi:hypothetical protein